MKNPSPMLSRAIATLAVVLGSVTLTAGTVLASEVNIQGASDAKPASGLMPAPATNPVDFGSGYIVDKVGALGSGQAELEAVLAELRAKTGVSLFVAYVDSFENPSNPGEWAEYTAVDNNLGRLGVLLAVAVNDREYAFSFDENFPLDEQTTDEIEANNLLPQLGQSNWLQAAIHYAHGLAEGFGETLGSTTAPTTPPTTTPTTPPGNTGGNEGSSTAWLGFLVVAGVGGGSWYLIHRSVKKRKAQQSGRDVNALSPAELKHQVARALIELDDSIKLSEQELGFAIAQFGEEQTTQFTDALNLAKQNINEAFKLKLLLDDKIPDTDAEIRGWSTEILRLCSEADAALEAQEQAFEALRKLEHNAPALLGALEEQLRSAAAETEQRRSLLPQLAAQYAPEAIASVAESPQQADALYQFASKQLATATTQVNSGRTSQAALSLRAAEQSLDQIVVLNRALAEIGPTLEEASRELNTLKTELQQDIINAEQLTAQASANGDTVPSIQDLQRIKHDTRNALAAAQGRDPVAELALLENINIQLDQLFVTTQNQLINQQRIREHLQRTLASANSAIAEANNFITTRRGAIGVDARTHLAEASRLFSEANRLTPTQPDQALQYANQAIVAAQNAVRMASADVRTQTGYSQPSSGPELGGILGSILGGMIGSSMGRNSGSSWNRPSSRPSGRSNRPSGGFGGFGGGRSGGFGGSGGSRSSGSRSSGGRRSGGGRF